MEKVVDVMNRNFVTVEPSTPINQVAQRMRTSKSGIIPVCDKGKIRGVIAAGDIVCNVVADTRNPKREQAKTLMNNSYPMVSPGEEIIRAAILMVKHRVQALPVTQNGKVIGVLTWSDILRLTPGVVATLY